MEILPLFHGFPGSSDRGFLGWSSCVLLKGERIMLFDTLGYNERYALLAALERRGVAPEEVEVVFLSHFHFDHAVNYRLFPNATLYLHEREVAYAQANHQKDLAIPIEMLEDLQATGRLRLLEGHEGLAEGVVWFLAPGHTAGLYALRVMQGEQRLVLASDAVKNVGEVLTGEVAMAWDRNVSHETVAAIIRMADLILPGHDRLIRVVRQGQDIRFAPEGRTQVRIARAGDVPGAPREWLLSL